MADRAAPRSLRPPRPVLDIAETLEAAGFETWCVGGAVRDALLGHPHLDWDLATSATPAQVRGLFGARRTIPVGIEFGTVGVLDPDRTMHEVTTFRRDVRTDGRHA
ncbi:MAG: tRNA nucleotidyltransferase, partial [Gemmatimonadota bacterium]|nr:tRNA nucleotidyltransferase [Gemmatimonadota bacterium]